ncbi:NAD-dependent epimerase/dehydratase family protein [Variovorax sp. J22P168]|uniref:NAD-dependent epimerase/dehydratase family protein n=1 Tax=Variovorax jilinensis TaxID=3053513 RepID=UPI0025774D88|nr:NAD-dependent epimerase/dehydratase family protein [Variovorax sp. J22P168]MDM0012563.1 NAD-dependent epimerase/dehydratase family protein [Variovorax sp. J22P168]
MPSINSPLGALPSRFRRQRVLLVGCGDVGLRAARLLGGRVNLIALTSTPARVPALRQAGIRPLVADLDRPSTLRRLAGLATRVLHLAPPARVEEDGRWWHDARSLALVRALRQRSLPAAFVYGSTSGVYGDCGGARIDETRALRPDTPRAHRRVDAERTVRWLGRAGVAVRILRIPGIYAPDREGGTPRERLARGTPVLRAEDDVYTNHIHADDLARACVAALWRGGTMRAFHASDDSEIRMGDYIELAARLYGLPMPPRIARDEAQARLPLSLLSFMGESRRLDNTRLKRELRLRLRYPTVATGLLPAA